MVFGIIPECRSDSFRNKRSVSPESPLPEAICADWRQALFRQRYVHNRGDILAFLMLIDAVMNDFIAEAMQCLRGPVLIGQDASVPILSDRRIEFSEPVECRLKLIIRSMSNSGILMFPAVWCYEKRLEADPWAYRNRRDSASPRSESDESVLTLLSG